MLGSDILSQMLIAAKGAQWRGLRSIMSPMFSSGKIKSMYPLIQEKTQALLDYCDREKDAQDVIDFDDAYTKFTLDVISACAFGMEINVLQGENVEFLNAVRSLFRFNFKFFIKFLVFSVCKPLFTYLNVKSHNPTMDYFINAVKETIKKRNEGPPRGDFVDMMLNAKKSEEQKKKDGISSSFGE